MGFIVRTFGVNSLRRDQLITRGPRFQVAFDANAAELADTSSNDDTNPNRVFRMGYKQQSVFEGTAGGTGISQVPSGGSPGIENINVPSVRGRYELQRCKVDSVSLGVMPGRRVAAVRWEGVAEGISFVSTSLQKFKNSVYGTNVAKNISTAPGTSTDFTQISRPGAEASTGATLSGNVPSNNA